MASPLRWSARVALAVIFLVVLCQQVAALDIQYCSDINTSGSAKNTSIYQSNGLCFDFCNDKTASFAIVQYNGCWCSNYAPADTTTGCTQDCPGFPDDKCGDADAGLYGYIALPRAASGTQGGSAASSTSADQAATSSTMRTTRSSSSTTTSTSSTWTPTPVTSLETVTGQVRTVTVTPTAPPNSQATNGISKADSGGGGGLTTGGAVGLTVGLVALIAIISAIVYFCFRKRRKEREAELNNVSRRGSSAGFGSAAGQIPSRTMSENSRYVLGTDGRRVVENWEPGDAPDVRRSRLIPVDQRLDPFSPVYQRGDNKSRESVNTIRDDHDYSRRMVSGPGILRATNPDT